MAKNTNVTTQASPIAVESSAPKVAGGMSLEAVSAQSVVPSGQTVSAKVASPTLALSTGDQLVAMVPGQLYRIKAQVGHKYKMVKLSPTGEIEEIADNVIAVKQGDNLQLRFEDGTTADIEGFYSVCKAPESCSATVASDTATGTTLGGASTLGAAIDGGTLVYAHGASDVLMGMAQGQGSLQAILVGLGDGSTMVSYFPTEFGLAAAAVTDTGSSTGFPSMLGFWVSPRSVAEEEGVVRQPLWLQWRTQSLRV